MTSVSVAILLGITQSAVTQATATYRGEALAKERSLYLVTPIG
jgi:predicted transcriptional regulator